MTRLPIDVRHQAEVLARAFEAGAFDDRLVTGSLSDERVRASRANVADEVLVAFEEFLGRPVLASALRQLRLAIADDPSGLGRPPNEVLSYRRWLLVCDVGKALGRRRALARDGRKKRPLE